MHIGSIYPLVPCTTVVTPDSSIGTYLEAPKSATFDVRDSSKSMLTDLTSLWMIGIEVVE
jgi:hypothetical protein